MGLYENLLQRRDQLVKEIRDINDSNLSHEEKETKTYFLDKEMEEVEQDILAIELQRENI